jgi:hypothetical protein
MQQRFASFPMLLSFPAVTLTLLLALAPLGCSDEAATETDATAEIRVSATTVPTSGAPSPTSEDPAAAFTSVSVSVSRMYLVPEGNTGEHVDLMTGGPATLDLMHLDADAPRILSEVSVPAGRYSQLRIVVDKADVTLAGGLTFDGGETTRTLVVPSGEQTGIKVNILGPIEADPGSWTSLLVDFDASRNFVIQGNPDTPAGIREVLFKPVLNEVSRTSLPSESEKGDGQDKNIQT